MQIHNAIHNPYPHPPSPMELGLADVGVVSDVWGRCCPMYSGAIQLVEPEVVDGRGSRRCLCGTWCLGQVLSHARGAIQSVGPEVGIGVGLADVGAIRGVWGRCCLMCTGATRLPVHGTQEHVFPRLWSVGHYGVCSGKFKRQRTEAFPPQLQQVRGSSGLFGQSSQRRHSSSLEAPQPGHMK